MRVPAARLHAVILTVIGAACQSPSGLSGAADGPGPRRRGTAVQALIGAAEYHALELERQDPGSPPTAAEIDLSTMPALGIAGQHPLAGERTQLGLDGGLVFSWESDSDAVTAPGGTVLVAVDLDLLVVDAFFGLYASTTIADQVRLYAAAGPAVMWGQADYRDEVTAAQESAFGFGAYVRGGAEYRLEDRSFLGVGVRGVMNELDFGGTIGELDLEGWQVFLTFTQGF